MLFMARFFFHIREGNRTTLDPVGEYFTGLDAARMNALAFISQTIVNDLRILGTVRQRYVDIAGEDGRVVATIPFLASQAID